MENSSSGQKATAPPMGKMYMDPKRLASIFHWFILLLLIGLVVGSSIALSVRSYFSATVFALCLLPVLFTLLLVRWQYFEIAAIFLAVILITAITLTASRGFGIHQLSVLGYPTILIVASLVTRKRVMLLILLYNILCVAWLVFGAPARVNPPDLLPSTPGSFLSVAIILVITAFMIRLLSESLFHSAQQLQQELLERKLAEQKYRDIFENAMEGIFQSTTGGRFINVNPAMARIYGYNSPADMVHSVTDIAMQLYVKPEMRQDLRRRLTEGEKIKGFESLDYRKDGSTVWTSMNVQAIRDTSGHILYFEGTVEDITQQKLADEALRNSEERYRTLYNGMLDGVYRSTHAGRFMDVNPALVRMLGYQSRTEMLELDIPQALFFAPEERITDTLAPGEERVDTFRMKRKDGSEIWVEDHGHDVHDEHGNTIFHEGILRDVTPRLIAETERRQAEKTLRQFKSIMDDTHDAIFIIDPRTSQYRYFNERACQLLGYSHAELSQLGVIDIATHLTSLEAWLERAELVRSSNGLIFETTYRRKDGSLFPVEVSAKVHEYAGQETVTASVRDITERHHAEQEREKLITELETKNRELEQFTYTVSHDLKAPLITIKGFLGFLEKDVSEQNQAHIHNDVTRINEAVDKMHRLLTELLELSRIGRMMNAPETIPFGDLLKDALDIVHGRLAARRVTVQTQPNLPAVHGDRQRLTEVLQNLLDNAAKFMGDQPEPRIEIGQRGEEEGQPVFFIRDNGIGIPLEQQERIFGLFNKLDVRTEGTGIGLALVKRIVEVHGGRLWVESEAGQGATFYFTLEKAEG